MNFRDREPALTLVCATVAAWILFLALLITGCASTIDQVVRDARRTPWQDAAYAPIPGNDAVEQYALLRNAAANLGITVVEQETSIEGAAGTFSSAFQTIELEPGMDINARVEVLSHELGHSQHPARQFSKPEAETFAELVGVEVQRRLGYKAGAKTSGRYLAAYKMGLYIATAYAVDIDKAATTIVNAARLAQP